MKTAESRWTRSLYPVTRCEINYIKSFTLPSLIARHSSPFGGQSME